MSASNEWAEWHLTPRGWEQGQVRLDFQPINGNEEPPADRVLTYIHEEHMGSIYSNFDITDTETWRSENEEKVKQLLIQFGDCPNSL